MGVRYFCDASVLARGGIPSVVFGPGDIAQAHTADEWISLRAGARHRTPREVPAIPDMSDLPPSVTVVIPARVGQDRIDAVDAALALEASTGALEVLVARGRQPSVQRNLAVRQARGELIYFLDDDSRPARENLRRAAVHFQQPNVIMVGGPTLCPRKRPGSSACFSRSWEARWPSDRVAPAIAPWVAAGLRARKN